MKLTDNKVLITGGSSGIGLALCNAFYAKGNQVIIVGRNAARLADARASREGIFTYVCDLEKSAQIDDLSRWIHQSHPDVNVIINNAGVQYNYNILEEGHLASKIEQEVQINLLAPLRLISLLLPDLVNRDQAAIVNVTSGLALVPKPSAAAYCASKAGLRSFTYSLRYQLRDTSIKIFELLPPVVETAMTAGRTGDMVAPEVVADGFMDAFERNQEEIRIGKIKALFAINRIAPQMAKKLVR